MAVSGSARTALAKARPAARRTDDSCGKGRFISHSLSGGYELEIKKNAYLKESRDGDGGDAVPGAGVRRCMVHGINLTNGFLSFPR